MAAEIARARSPREAAAEAVALGVRSALAALRRLGAAPAPSPKADPYPWVGMPGGYEPPPAAMSDLAPVAWSGAPERAVPVADLVATQASVRPDRVERFVRHPEAYARPPRHRGPGAPRAAETMKVAEVGGRMFVHDGHHRLAAARLRGDPEVWCAVIVPPPALVDGNGNISGQTLAGATFARAPRTPSGADAVRITSDMLETRAAIDAASVVSRIEDAVIAEADRLFRQGLSPSEVADQMLAYLGTLSSKSLGAAGRQAVNAAHNLGRNLETQLRADEVAFVVRTAILDKATCGPCAGLDGRKYEVDSPAYWRNMPPAQCEGLDNCRCFYLDVFGVGAPTGSPTLGPESEDVAAELGEPSFETALAAAGLRTTVVDSCQVEWRPGDDVAAGFDESKHPREPAGSEKGGEFAPVGEGVRSSGVGVDPNGASYVVNGQIQYPIDRGYKVVGSVFRGVTSAEAASIIETGKIESTKAYSHSSEGTSYGDDLAVAESYVNVGRDNPLKTGLPTFVIEVSRGAEHVVDQRDGYVKSAVGVPASRIVRVWRFDPGGGVTVHRTLDDALGAALGFDESRHPRHEAGSPEGGEFAPAGGGSSGAEDLTRATGVSMFRDVLDRIGEPVPVFISRRRRSFEVGDKQFSEAGHFDPAKQRIVIRAHAALGVTEEAVTALLAHEVMHAAYDRVDRAVAEERARLIEDSRAFMGTSDDGGPKDPLSRVGWLKPEFFDRYPTFAAFSRSPLGEGTADIWKSAEASAAFKGRRDRIDEEDGVSEYSRAYWAVVGKSHVTLDRRTAINETLAEIARITTESYRPSDRGRVSIATTSRAWKELFSMYVREYRRLSGKKFLPGVQV